MGSVYFTLNPTKYSAACSNAINSTCKDIADGHKPERVLWATFCK